MRKDLDKWAIFILAITVPIGVLLLIIVDVLLKDNLSVEIANDVGEILKMIISGVLGISMGAASVKLKKEKSDE